MKKFFNLLMCLSVTVGMNACTPENTGNGSPAETPGRTDTPDKPDTPEPKPEPAPTPEPESGKTLVVYYSYTNNVHTLVGDLSSQIEVDFIRVEPAEKGLDYAANNYAIGSSQIQEIRNNPGSASSYPAIDPVDVDFSRYSTIIVATPLWWSNMAAPMQTFLFNHGKEMAGKRIGLIVSSASSGISGVESDAKRLVPDGNFLSRSLWIRSSQTSGCHPLISAWLSEIGYGI